MKLKSLTLCQQKKKLHQKFSWLWPSCGKKRKEKKGARYTSLPAFSTSDNVFIPKVGGKILGMTTLFRCVCVCVCPCSKSSYFRRVHALTYKHNHTDVAIATSSYLEKCGQYELSCLVQWNHWCIIHHLKHTPFSITTCERVSQSQLIKCSNTSIPIYSNISVPPLTALNILMTLYQHFNDPVPTF